MQRCCKKRWRWRRRRDWRWLKSREARAIREELDSSNGATQVDRVVPLFIEGEYEVTVGADKTPRVRLSVSLRTLNASRSIETA